MNLVGTVKKKTKINPAKNMLPAKERLVYSTNFAYHRDATVSSYFPKIKKAAVFLSSKQMSK